MPRPHPALRFGRPQVFAHRGGSALRPENTFAAFDHGLSLGADGLELDVHLSRDDVVVVHHDATLDRTTNGTGPIAARSAAELAALDAGWHFGVAAVSSFAVRPEAFRRWRRCCADIEAFPSLSS